MTSQISGSNYKTLLGSKSDQVFITQGSLYYYKYYIGRLLFLAHSDDVAVRGGACFDYFTVRHVIQVIRQVPNHFSLLDTAVVPAGQCLSSCL